MTPRWRAPAAAVGAARPAPGERRGVRDEGGLGASRLPRPGRPWRRAGRDQAAYGWTTPPWFGRVAEEARAVRERAGIIDLSSFGKIDVDGPGALALLDRVAGADEQLCCDAEAQPEARIVPQPSQSVGERIGVVDRDH